MTLGVQPGNASAADHPCTRTRFFNKNQWIASRKWPKSSLCSYFLVPFLVQKMYFFSVSFLIRFWLHFGSKNGPKMVPKTAPQQERGKKTEKREIALPLIKNQWFLGLARSKNWPKMKILPEILAEKISKKKSKNDPKMVQKWSKKCLKFKRKLLLFSAKQQ